MRNFKRGFAPAAAILLASCNGSGSVATEREEVLEIFSALDDRSLSVGAQLENYRSDAVILVPNETEHRGADAIRAHLSGFGNGVEIVTRHEIVELTSFDDLVTVQGRVVGTAQPDGDPNVYAFETKNLILFRPTGETGDLKIWRVIYNAAPTPETP